MDVNLTRCNNCGCSIPADAYHSDGICPFCNPVSDEREVHKKDKEKSCARTLKIGAGETSRAVESPAQLNLWGKQ